MEKLTVNERIMLVNIIKNHIHRAEKFIAENQGSLEAFIIRDEIIAIKQLYEKIKT